jgi:hypothetical protein
VVVTVLDAGAVAKIANKLKNAGHIFSETEDLVKTKAAIKEAGLDGKTEEKVVQLLSEEIRVGRIVKKGDIRPAEIVREVKFNEKIADLVEFSKYQTRITNQEHALIKLNGKRYLVKGGRDGIILPNETEIIFGHTHPPVGKGQLNDPSTEDRSALNIVNFGKGQSKQYIFHDGKRTTIFKGDMVGEKDYTTTQY